tara:strand:+ start:8505 stop:8693 length:189 start_codon:yes stop_codon:yes gene_type:complete
MNNYKDQIDKSVPSINYRNDEINSIINNVSGKELNDRPVEDKPMADLMQFVFGDILNQEEIQ